MPWLQQESKPRVYAQVTLLIVSTIAVVLATASVLQTLRDARQLIQIAKVYYAR